MKNKIKKNIYVTLFLGLFLPLIAWSAVLDPVTKEINACLVGLAKTWNAGDLDAVLKEYYDASASTMHVSSGSGIIQGYDNIAKRFHSEYPTPAKMGHLTFSDVTVQVLSPNYAMAVGKWQLTRKKDEDIDGVFSTLYEKTNQGWKIVLDHAS